MKRLLLNVVVMLLTFAVGALSGRVVLKVADKDVSVEQATVATKVAPVPEAIPEVTPLSEPFAQPTPHLILDYDPKKFVLSGYFTFLSPKPKEFEDFSFDLDLFEGEDGRPSGNISVNSNSVDIYDHHAAVFGFVTERATVFCYLSGFSNRS